MINFFVWKQKTTFLARSLLILACCLMVMLGGMLVTNESHAQTCEITAFPGDRVVLQNTPWRNVRYTPHVENNNKLGEVSKGTRGIIEDDSRGEHIVRDGKYVWYYVKWESLIKAGWTTGMIDDQSDHNTEKWISTIEEANQKDAIVKALFNPPNCDYITADETNHDYNDYGCNATWGQDHWYPEKGHSGWDVVAKDGAPVPFYSLTAGTFLEEAVDSNNTIAIYNEDNDMTIMYLHADKICIEHDDKYMVKVGARLGIQGKTGNTTGVHVHIEVQEGESLKPAAKNWETGEIHGNKTTNPIPYLYDNWVVHTRQGGGGSPNEDKRFDVNNDGVVNLLDLLEVLRNVGTDNLQCDVNGDEKVDMADCNKIKTYLDNSFRLPHSFENLLERNTRLLTNYPNPFNPETWIPYQLARTAEVSISIHAADGTEVRTLDLGHRPAGLYLQRSRAAYWDGRNTLGEEVASGIYFYTLSTGDFTTIGRMVIRR